MDWVKDRALVTVSGFPRPDDADRAVAYYDEDCVTSRRAGRPPDSAQVECCVESVPDGSFSPTPASSHEPKLPDLLIPSLHRFLVRFHPKRIAHVFTDVLIIGSGIAGLRAALELPESLHQIVVSKDQLSQSNSAYAQGGIAGALDPVDDFTSHAADTIAAGKGMCDPAIVEMVVREAPERIGELLHWGTVFDTVNGELALTREGGHTHRRVAHALQDATGQEIMRALIAAARALRNAAFWEQTFIIDLLTFEGRCRGAVVWNREHGKTLVWAKETILATGGAGQIYRETTNPAIATADGHAVAFRAGAEMRDMEFMQFHPTVLYIAGSSRHLISEAVRGEGAYLRDCAGYRFMGDYCEQLELAPRDEVSHAIALQMEKTRHPCVYLDLSHLPQQMVRERFPHIGRVCREFGLDITRDPIPVRPGAHYMIGGCTVDAEGQTTLPGLWAAGEVTSSGLHGANRLASNSLLEGLVFGRRAGLNAAAAAQSATDSFSAVPLISDWPQVDDGTDDELNLTDLRNSLGAEMWRSVGIQRNQPGLESAQKQVEFWSRYVATREFLDPRGWELQNMLLVSRLIIAAALSRNESRGTHFRSDHPSAIPNAARHITLATAPEQTSNSHAPQIGKQP
ncbi:MAG: L-aspartate oxidase [Planctomycetaceae bacterium]|nr:MAG: L-aspartate oxidase [Planctomycetaceae bacterium]